MTVIPTGVTCSVVINGTIHVLSTSSQRLIVTVFADGAAAVAQGASASAAVDMSATSSFQVTFGSSSATGTQTAQLLSMHVTKVTA
jgi:predicted naringenin-chalcone synthase